MDLEDDEEEDQLGVDPPEDQFTVLTSRNRGNRSSNMSSNSDSSENSGLLRSDKVKFVVLKRLKITLISVNMIVWYVHLRSVRAHKHC